MEDSSILGIHHPYQILPIEPAMDDLILMVFGDESIFLTCNSGECLHYTMVPGFKASDQKAMEGTLWMVANHTYVL